MPRHWPSRRSWADTAATAWHFRTAVGQEVDLVLETPNQRIVGIEIQAGASLTQRDVDGLREFRAAARRAFTRGAVLCTGEQLLPFEDKLWAEPLARMFHECRTGWVGRAVWAGHRAI